MWEPTTSTAPPPTQNVPMTARIAIVADHDVTRESHREIDRVLPLLGPDVNAVWVSPARLASADLTQCDGLWFVTADPAVVPTDGERAAYDVGHRLAAGGTPILSMPEGWLPQGSLTGPAPHPQLHGFVQAARWRGTAREMQVQRDAQATWLAEQDAIPRTYVHQQRGPRHRWWRPLISLGLLVFLWFMAASVISVPFFLTGDVETIDDATSTWTGNLWLNLSLAVLIPATVFALWVGHQRGWGRVFSVTGRLRWGWLLRSMALLTPLWLAYLTAFWVLSGQEVLPRPEQWVGMLIVCLLTTPLQATGEEVAFRGGLVQSIGSWFRSPLLALGITTVISTALFVAAHGSMSPWIWIDIGSLGIAACYLTWRTGGLECAIALHVVTNVLITVQGILLGGLDDSYVDTETTGDPGGAFLSALVMVTASALLLWAARRRGIAPKGFLTPARG